MKQLFEKTYSNTYHRVGLHILFWVLLTATNYYFNTISFNPVSDTPAAYLLALKSTAEFSIAFYSLMYWIFPKFIAKRRWIKATMLLIAWLVFISLFDSWADQQIFNICPGCAINLKKSAFSYYQFLQNNISNIAMARLLSGGLLYTLIIQLSLPVAVKLARNYFRQTVQQLQLAKDNLQLEFNFLKSQVNPHFLFNTLNNIYSLVINEKKEQAAATIARLSGFMRYALYESNDEKILLEKEVQLIRDYVELEKLRLNETEVLFHYETDSREYTVPPLLLMPAIENAFKYSGDKNGDVINISVRVEKSALEVKIENAIDANRQTRVGGIGLQNLKKRLQHNYGETSSCTSVVLNNVHLFQLTCSL